MDLNDSEKDIVRDIYPEIENIVGLLEHMVDCNSDKDMADLRNELLTPLEEIELKAKNML